MCGLVFIPKLSPFRPPFLPSSCLPLLSHCFVASGSCDGRPLTPHDWDRLREEANLLQAELGRVDLEWEQQQQQQQQQEGAERQLQPPSEPG